ncbi:hypothetical protein KR215_004145, partial [Drosophila sulfurigaster]
LPLAPQILGQMPPVLPVRSGIPPVDAFYLMFPALSSLLRWGSLFPAQSILGAMPDNLQQSASKVVLVLADDANAQKSRVTRQNAPIVPPNPLNAPVMLQQLLSQMPQPSLGQSWLPDGLVGQMPPMPALPNIQDFNLGQSLAGLQLPPLDGLLGAPPPAPAAVTPPPPPPAAAKAATDDVAQAPPAVAQAPPPPFAGFFDGTNNMLGSALAAMPQAPTPDAFMAGLRQFWPGAAPAAAADATAQASDISEVRVKPETPESSSIINYRDPEQREAQLAQLKLKSALQMEQDKQRVPLLWFRMPPTSSNTKTTNSPTEQREIETKLQMFERQVIAELKLLQQIEALAREMRANAQEGGRQQQQQPAYKLRYPLSRTPVHKITRSDIERALRDDYVRRLLNKEAQRKVQGSAAFKRQATTPQQTLSKEDIVNVMAYAYRLANEKQRAAATAEATPQMQQQQRQFDAAEQQAVKEKTQQQQQQQEMIMRQMMSQPMEQQQQQQQLLMQRQWMEEQAKRQQQQAQQEAMARQMDAMQRQAAIDQQQQQQLAERQWADAKMRAMQQQRQWTEETMKLKQQQQQLQQQAQQQRQWTEEAMKQQTKQQQQQQPGMDQQQQLRQWEQPAERQWADEKMKAMRQQAEQQRQWSEESIRQQQQQQQQQAEQQQQMRQWSEDATKLKQQQQAEQMRQWTEDATKLKQQQQQQQAEQQQLRQWEQAEDQQQQQQPRQWTEDATKVKQQEQQQQAEQQPMRMETDGDGLMVGEATPQMPETDGKERHKGNLYGVFRSRLTNPVPFLRNTVDVLGLGGNHHKKVKSKVAPTIINYYQQAPPPRPVAYQYAPPAPSSYGTSYGGGGYGSNAYGGYRAAVGNDAIDSMLREHQVLAAAIKPPTDDNSNTTTATLTTDDDNNNHRIQKRLAQFPATALDRTSGGCGCGSAHCACGSSCRCGQRNHMQQEQQQQVKAPSMRRVRRSAEPHTEAEPATNAGYGTLETIDEGSLNVLRKEYKLGLKEITLSPDEDPAEALMRYNAASIREALERASQEPLEISGDQLAAGVEAGAEEDYGSGATAETPTETETETPNYESETGAKTQELPPQQDAPNGGSNETVASELAAARAEFQKLYQLIQSLKEQLHQAEQGLRDCQHAERCTTTSTTSTSTPSTTTSTSTTSTTTTTTPRSNAIDGATTVLPYSEKSWERLLASKGYDTNYLSKTHQQQYTQGENLALPKAETSNASGDYSYQELQPYDPDNKSKRASGNGTSTSTTTTTTERSNVAHLLNSLMDEQEEEEEKEQQLEQQSADGDSNAIATTPTPYALRGKFVRRRSASSRLDSHSQSQVRSVVRTTRQAKVTRREHTELAVLRARSTKLDQLIDVLHELLRLQLQRERSAISQVKSNPNSISSTKKLRTRRLRRK